MASDCGHPRVFVGDGCGFEGSTGPLDNGAGGAPEGPTGLLDGSHLWIVVWIDLCSGNVGQFDVSMSSRIFCAAQVCHSPGERPKLTSALNGTIA